MGKLSENLILIGVKDLSGEDFFPYGEETVRRYFRSGIFQVHEIGHDGVSLLTVRGSAIVRHASLKRLQILAKRYQKRMSLQEIGSLMNEVAGRNDEYILSRLEKNVPTQEISEGLIEKIEQILKST